MKMKLIAATVIVAFSAGAAMANECGLNARQLAAGWTCPTTTESLGTQVIACEPTRIPRPTPPNPDNTVPGRIITTAEVTLVSWTALNPAGNEAEDKSGSREELGNETTATETGNCPGE